MKVRLSSFSIIKYKLIVVLSSFICSFDLGAEEPKFRRIETDPVRFAQHHFDQSGIKTGQKIFDYASSALVIGEFIFREPYDKVLGGASLFSEGMSQVIKMAGDHQFEAAKKHIEPLAMSIVQEVYPSQWFSSTPFNPDDLNNLDNFKKTTIMADKIVASLDMDPIHKLQLQSALQSSISDYIESLKSNPSGFYSGFKGKNQDENLNALETFYNSIPESEILIFKRNTTEELIKFLNSDLDNKLSEFNRDLEGNFGTNAFHLNEEDVKNIDKKTGEYEKFISGMYRPSGHLYPLLSQEEIDEIIIENRRNEVLEEYKEQSKIVHQWVQGTQNTAHVLSVLDPSRAEFYSKVSVFAGAVSKFHEGAFMLKAADLFKDKLDLTKLGYAFNGASLIAFAAVTILQSMDNSDAQFRQHVMKALETISKQINNLSKQIEDVQKQMDEYFKAVFQEFGRLHLKLDTLESEIINIKIRLEKIEAKLNFIDKKIDHLKLSSYEQKIKSSMSEYLKYRNNYIVSPMIISNIQYLPIREAMIQDYTNAFLCFKFMLEDSIFDASLSGTKSNTEDIIDMVEYIPYYFFIQNIANENQYGTVFNPLIFQDVVQSLIQMEINNKDISSRFSFLDDSRFVNYIFEKINSFDRFLDYSYGNNKIQNLMNMRQEKIEKIFTMLDDRAKFIASNQEYLLASRSIFYEIKKHNNDQIHFDTINQYELELGIGLHDGLLDVYDLEYYSDSNKVLNHEYLNGSIRNLYARLIYDIGNLTIKIPYKKDHFRGLEIDLNSEKCYFCVLEANDKRGGVVVAQGGDDSCDNLYKNRCPTFTEHGCVFDVDDKKQILFLLEPRKDWIFPFQKGIVSELELCDPNNSFINGYKKKYSVKNFFKLLPSEIWLIAGLSDGIKMDYFLRSQLVETSGELKSEFTNFFSYWQKKWGSSSDFVRIRDSIFVNLINFFALNKVSLLISHNSYDFELDLGVQILNFINIDDFIHYTPSIESYSQFEIKDRKWDNNISLVLPTDLSYKNHVITMSEEDSKILIDFLEEKRSNLKMKSEFYVLNEIISCTGLCEDLQREIMELESIDKNILIYLDLFFSQSIYSGELNEIVDTLQPGHFNKIINNMMPKIENSKELGRDFSKSREDMINQHNDIEQKLNQLILREDYRLIEETRSSLVDYIKYRNRFEYLSFDEFKMVQQPIIMFDVNSSNIKSQKFNDPNKYIDGIAHHMTKGQGRDGFVVLTGYSDKSGKDVDKNKDLALERADKVKKRLIGLGVSENRIIVDPPQISENFVYRESRFVYVSFISADDLWKKIRNLWKLTGIDN